MTVKRFASAGRDEVPHRVGLRVAVQHQQRRAGAAVAQPDRPARHWHVGQGETVEEHRLLLAPVLS